MGRLASYFVVVVHMQMDLGDGNQLETESGGGRCRFSANVLVLRLMVSAYSMLNARTKSAVGLCGGVSLYIFKVVSWGKFDHL